MGADDEARALNVKLGEEEEQSFQLFHPESAREIALQAKLMQASDQLDHKRKKDAEEEEEAKRRRGQDASDWASINVLTMAPIQEGMQSVPDSEVRSSGVATLRRANLEAVREQLRKTFLEEGRVDTMEASDIFTFLLRPLYTRAWDSIPQHLYDAMVDQGFCPRLTSGELLVMWCLRPHTEDEPPLGDSAALRPYTHLLTDGIQTAVDALVVPTAEMEGLVHSALSKLPQPVSPEEAQKTWDYVWKLCRDAAAGPPTCPTMNSWTDKTCSHGRTGMNHRRYYNQNS